MPEEQNDKFMTVEDAIDLVLELARQSVLRDEDIVAAPDLQEEKTRQETAIGVIDDFFCNVVFEERLAEDELPEGVEAICEQCGEPAEYHSELILCKKCEQLADSTD